MQSSSGTLREQALLTEQEALTRYHLQIRSVLIRFKENVNNEFSMYFSELWYIKINTVPVIQESQSLTLLWRLKVICQVFWRTLCHPENELKLMSESSHEKVESSKVKWKKMYSTSIDERRDLVSWSTKQLWMKYVKLSIRAYYVIKTKDSDESRVSKAKKSEIHIKRNSVNIWNQRFIIY